MKEQPRFISIRRKIMLAIFLISLFSTIAFTFHAYTIQREEIYNGHINQLKVAALAVPHLLPPGFHDRIVDEHSVSEEEHLEIMWMMTAWAQDAGVSFVYSFVRRGDEVFFTSTSGTEEQRREGTWVPFFEPYEASDEVLAIFDTSVPQMDAEEDEFGHFLSVVLPMTNQAGEVYLAGADVYIDKVREQLQATIIHCIVIGLIVFGIMSAVGIGFSNRVARPVITLADQTKRLSDQGFAPDEAFEEETNRIAQTSSDEVGRLAAATVQMVRKLQDYIENIKLFTAAKERIESELNIARNIQMSFLPKHFPPYPGVTEFDLYAMLEPAREVGGDLYDFFMLDDDHLFFGVGDVSCKGVPSALFMAVTKTLFKGMANPKDSPSTIMTRVNDELRESNEALMFVTVFCGVLNIRTGVCHYSNAGHNPPVLLRKGQDPTFLDIPKGFILGVEEFAYATQSITLQPGDQILLYTDGVTEAMDADKKLFGDARMMDTIKQAPKDPPRKLVETLMKSVHAYAEGEPQSDDVTILSVAYYGA